MYFELKHFNCSTLQGETHMALRRLKGVNISHQGAAEANMHSSKPVYALAPGQITIVSVLGDEIAEAMVQEHQSNIERRIAAGDENVERLMTIACEVIETHASHEDRQDFDDRR